MSAAPKARPPETLRVLFVHVGNPVDPNTYEAPVLAMETLTRGRCTFKEKEVINNVTTRRYIAAHEGIDLEAVCFTERRSLSGLWRSGRALRRRVRAGRFDLVHAYWGASSGFTVALCAPVPVVLTFAGSDLLGNYDARGRRTRSGQVSALLSQAAACLAARVVVPAARLGRALWPYARARARVIPQGVDPQKFYPMDPAAARAEVGFGPGEKVILFFPGEKSWVKDPALAEATLAHVRQHVPEARLCFVTHVPHERLVFYYNAADALLLTSRHEGSNNSIKEALCCNLPVVSTDVGDARERLGPVRHSYVVAGRDPAVLAAPLIDILQRGVRSDGARHAGAVSLAAVTEQHVMLYREVFGR